MEILEFKSTITKEKFTIGAQQQIWDGRRISKLEIIQPDKK